MSNLFKATLRSLYMEEMQATLRLGWPPKTARRIVAHSFRLMYL